MNRTERRQLAERQVIETARLERIGVRQSSYLSTRIRSAVIAAYSRGLNPALTSRIIVNEIRPIILDAMVTAHLKGRLRSQINVAAHIASKKKAFASTYDDALDYLQQRLELTPNQVSSITQKYGSEAVRVTKGLSDEIESKVAKAVLSATRGGVHVREGMGLIRKAIGNDVSKNLLETLFRTQTNMAYSAGRWNANQSADIQEILWGYEYSTVGDTRVRPNHSALHGTKLPKDDPIWGRIWTPNGYNCRCTITEVFDTDDHTQRWKSEQVIDGQKVIAGPDEGWGFNPGQIFTDSLN